MTNTINEFIETIAEHEYSEELIRKTIDKAAYWTDRVINDEEYHILHLYLNFLSQKFSFNIDTNIDSR